MEEFDVLGLLLILLAAWVGGAVATRIGYPAILGELLIGILLGPAFLGILAHSEMVSILAEVGILLLMVYIGMEIDFRDLGKASWPGLLAALGGFIVPFGLGYYTLLAFGETQMAALFVAIAVGVTSLATKSRILVDLKLLNTRIAYVLMAGALISDTLALVIFAGIVSIVSTGAIDLISISMVVGKIVLFFIITAAIGLYLLPLLGRYLDKAGIKSRTLHFTLLLIITLGFAELAELAGMHSILGAFMAGLFIRDGVFNRKVSRELHDVFYDVSVGFLAPIFFVSAGFHVNFNVFQTDLALLAVVIVVAILGKVFGTALFYLPSGYGWREGITVGAGMNGRGAVEIIIAGIGLQMGIIDEDIFSILVFMAIFTTATVPFFLTWTTTWLRKRGELVQTEKKKGFLILGANPLGVLIARHLKSQSPVYMIDANKDYALEAKKEGFKCVNGNALKEEVMKEANANDVNTFLSLTGNSEINLLTAQLASETFSIPHKYVLISPSEGGVDVDLLDPIGASTMFAHKVFLDKWLNKISSGSVEEVTENVDTPTSTRKWLKKSIEKHGEVLPFIIENKEGIKRPFHYDDEVLDNERVVFLTPV